MATSSIYKGRCVHEYVHLDQGWVICNKCGLNLGEYKELQEPDIYLEQDEVPAENQGTTEDF